MKTIIEYLNEFANDYIEANDGEHFEEMCKEPELYMAASGVAEKAGIEFAKQVAQKALEDAAERADAYDGCYDGGQYCSKNKDEKLKQSILSTPLIIE